MKIDIDTLVSELTRRGWYSMAIRIKNPEFRNDKFEDILTNPERMVEYLSEHMWDSKETITEIVERCCSA